MASRKIFLSKDFSCIERGAVLLSAPLSRTSGRKNGAVAQLVEHRVRNAGVVSPNLIRSTIFKPETRIDVSPAADRNGSGFGAPRGATRDSTGEQDPKGNTMPKKKTNKAAKKRCHVTATGKVLATRAGKSHLLSSMSRKRKRNLRGTATLGNKEQAKTIKSQLSS